MIMYKRLRAIVTSLWLTYTSERLRQVTPYSGYLTSSTERVCVCVCATNRHQLSLVFLRKLGRLRRKATAYWRVCIYKSCKRSIQPHASRPHSLPTPGFSKGEVAMLICGSTSILEHAAPGVVLKQPIGLADKYEAARIANCFSVERRILERLGPHVRVVR